VRYLGVALNDKLLQGSDLMNSLVGVLLRFRQGKIAFTADINAMFFQILVDPHNWDSLRFLWWPKHDISRQSENYQTDNEA